MKSAAAVLSTLACLFVLGCESTPEEAVEAPVAAEIPEYPYPSYEIGIVADSEFPEASQTFNPPFASQLPSMPEEIVVSEPPGLNAPELAAAEEPVETPRSVSPQSVVPIVPNTDPKVAEPAPEPAPEAEEESESEPAAKPARPMAEAMVAITARNYPQALEILMENANAENPAAQEYVGEFYARGFGVAKDSSRACSWYQRAALLGNQVAKSKLARCFLTADGRYKDIDKAVELLTEAADAAGARAICMLGRMYMDGAVLEADPARGVSMCQMAAELGDVVAQVVMGDVYKGGDFVTPDLSASRAWYERAASRNDAEAFHRLGELYREGDGVPKDAEKAVELFIRAADQGHELATFDAAAVCFELIGLGNKKRSADGRFEVNVPYIEKAYQWSKIADRYDYDFRRKNLMWRIHDLTRSFLFQASPSSVGVIDRLVDDWKPEFRLN